MSTKVLEVVIVGSNQTAGAFSALDVAFGNIISNIASSAWQSLTGTLDKIADFTAGAIEKSAGLESQMSDTRAVLNATADDTARLSALIDALGMDSTLKVNANEAADAIYNLATNGLTAQQILDGAARSTVLLANATGGEFTTSATVATDVMALFGIAASDMSDAVNGISSVAVASKFDIENYRLALAQAGGVAALAGVEFDDFNAAIVAIAPAFASGSDAGTSFKTFLGQLTPSTVPATDAMRELGIITEDGKNQFYNANGELRSMAEIAGVLNGALSGLSEEQKSQALQTIFGTDAMRAAGMISQMTADDFRNLQATMAQTDAAEQAAIRMDNLAGSQEILAGTIETLQKKFGDQLNPILNDLIKNITPGIERFGNIAIEKFSAIAQSKEFHVFLERGSDLLLSLLTHGEKFLSGEYNFDKLVSPQARELLADTADAVNNLLDAFRDKAPAAQAEQAKLFGFISERGPEVTDFFGSVNGLLNAGADFWREWGDEIMAVNGFIMQLQIGQLTRGLALLTDGIKIVSSVLSGDFGGALKSANQLSADFVNFLTFGLSDKVAQSASEIGRKITDGVSSALSGDGIKNRLRYMLDVSFDFVRDFPEKFVGLGRDLLIGAMDGINQMSSSLVDALLRPFSDGIQRLRDLLDWNSPSGLFMEAGSDTMLGAILGANKNASGVIDALTVPFSDAVAGARQILGGADLSLSAAGIGISPQSYTTPTVPQITAVQQPRERATIQFGDVHIHNDMDMQQFEARLRAIIG